MIQTIIIFFCTALAGGAVNFQTRNNIHNRYGLIILTSMFISTLNLTLLKIIPNITCISDGIAYVLGGATGSFVALIMHKRFISKEKNI